MHLRVIRLTARLNTEWLDSAQDAEHSSIHMQVTTSTLQQPLQHAQVLARKFTDAQLVVIQEQKPLLQLDTLMYLRATKIIAHPSTEWLDSAQNVE